MEQEIQMQTEPIIYTSGGGAVDSVNGYAGVVVLTTSDLENTSDYQSGSEVESAISQAIDVEVTARQAADNNLQSQIDGITASSDVTDIVGTYAELENYDTSSLGDNDIIKVLQDESQNDETTYYRWSTSTGSFTLIGEEGPYYTKSAVDQLLNGKQDLLTAGANVQIQNNVISATNTTYSDFTGTDGTAAGTSGLVPAPAATDADKFLKSDGTWAEAGGGSSVNVVQTTGTSTADVMSQNAATSMVYADPGTKTKIQIGAGASSDGQSTISIGAQTYSTGTNAIAMGEAAKANSISSIAIGGQSVAGAGTKFAALAIGSSSYATGKGSIALGRFAKTTTQGEMAIGTTDSSYGYNSSNYRLLTGVYDGQSAHDAATYGQVISYSAINGAGAPTTATEGKYVGQLYYDTTNEAMYFLKEIDTTTTPATYTWEALGGGGSSINVVQTIGNSTTDVMSQNAVTGMIYADPGTNNKVRIYSTQSALGTYGIAIGLDARGAIAASSTISIGSNAQCGGNDSVSIGSSAKTINSRCVAIGYGASHSNVNDPAPGGAIPNTTVAIGSESAANNNWSTAIGTRAFAYYTGSVALGAGSKPTRAGEVNIGSQYSLYGYNSSSYRLLTGVYDGQSDHDAANVGQLNARVIGSLTAAPTTSTAGAVGALVATVESGTGHLYICTDDTGGTYTWQQLV